MTKIESAIANTILDLFYKKEVLITHMKLQKIFYFSYGSYLAKYDEKLIEHDFEAWPYGPVFPALWHALKRYKDSPIDRLIQHSDGTPYLYDIGNIFDVVNNIVDVCFHLSAWELSEITHAKDSPWFITVENEGYNEKIKNDLIKDYFKKYQILSVLEQRVSK